MSNAALFASGTLITLVFVIGIGLLVWGAILDGRYNREVRDQMAVVRRQRQPGARGDTRAGRTLVVGTWSSCKLGPSILASATRG